MANSDLFDKNINTIGEGIFNKLYSMEEKRQEYPLEYKEVDYYNHRKVNNQKEDYMRIGDCELAIPPEYIQVSTTGQSEEIGVLRQTSSLKQGRSKQIDQILIQFVVTGDKQVNGYKVNGPGGNTYYIDGFRSLLSQFTKAPFLPITNYVLNVEHNVYNVALASLAITAIKDYSDSFMVQMKMYKMNTSAYTNLPEVDFDNMFNWELFRWYYQKNLFKNDNNVTYFKPMDFDLRSIFNIGILKQEYVSKLQEGNDYDDINNPNNYNSIINNLDQSFVVENITCSMSNSLSKHEISGQTYPTYQFIGNTNKSINFEISTQDSRLIAGFKTLMDRNSKVMLENNNIEALGFARIQNEFVRMFGVEYLIIKEITTETQKGFPGLYKINVEAYDYQIDQRHKEAIKGFRPFPNNRDGTKDDLISQDKQGLINKIVQDSYVEKKIQYIELYPDLQLPTFKEIDQQIANINSFRKVNNMKPMNIDKYPKEKDDGIFADPDFYLFYPKISNDIKGNDDHNKTVNKTYDIDIDKLGIPLEIKTPIFTNATNSFTTIEEQMSGNISTMFCAMKEEKRGRLVNAFPSYMLLILDQANHWLDNQKLWTNYYFNQSLMSIDITHERTQPVGTAYLRVSNLYKTLEDEADFSKLKLDPQKDNYFYKEFGWHVGLKANENVIYNKNILKKRFKLNSGAKIQVRLGYGSNANNYPVNFNGYITSIQHDETINIVAQSDGRELVSQPFSGDEKSTNSIFKLGNEPTNIIKNILQNRQSFLSHIIPSWTESSKYGIESFGLINKHEYISYIFSNNKIYYDELFKEEIKENLINKSDDMEDEQINKMIIERTPDIFDGYTYKDEDLNSSAQEIEKYKLANMKINSADIISDPTTDWLAVMGGNLDQTKIYFDKKGVYQKQKFVNSYDLTKNIYAARPDKAVPYPSIDAETFAMLDGESNIKMFIDNMTTWDILKNLDYVMPSFICTPMYHQFESRIFYGKKHWISRYKYETREDGIIEKARSFQQWFYVNDKTEIINNTIKTDSSRLVTNAVTKWHHSSAGEEKGDLIHADATINYNKQRTNIFESDITGDLFGPDKLYNMLGWSIHEKNANLFSISQLKESFNRMYEGDLILRGISQIKPHDMIYIDDDYKKMYGNIEARRVTHSFEPKMGFITTIKPDLISATADESEDTLQLANHLNNVGRLVKGAVGLRTFLVSNFEINIAAYLLNNFHLGVAKMKELSSLKNVAIRNSKKLYMEIKNTDSLLEFYKKVQNYKIMEKVSLDKIKNMVSLSKNKEKIYTLSKNVINYKNELSSIATNTIKYRDELMALQNVDTLPSYYMEMDIIDDLTAEIFNKLDNVDDIGEISKTTKLLAKIMVQFKHGGFSVKSMKNSFKVIKGALHFSPAIVYMIVLDIIFDITLNTLIEWIDNRHSIIISPLIKDGEPFVIGVDGAQKLIPGYKFDSNLNAFVTSDTVIKTGNSQYTEEYGSSTVSNMNSRKTTNEGYAVSNNRSNRGPSLKEVERIKNDRSYKTGFIWPLDYANQDYDFAITSKFGRRVIKNKEDFHRGVDLAPPNSIKVNYEEFYVVAAEDGTVITAMNNIGGYGLYVSIDHHNNFKTVYAHLRSYSVESNQNVKKGDIIGIMGNTGGAKVDSSYKMKEHLHFEIRKNGTKVNPESYLPTTLMSEHKILR